ncbi:MULTISPECIES: transposase [Paraburkholderia]|uniref:transposase n=1 Tax=Paraburkholderia TaxID=1822464 RepID=UPI00068806EE|nr:MULTISPECIES: transposase [Paraburkholderia]MDH6153285.1 hypothetical protein [Paraburkholderia sp. WSM4179]
MSFGRASEWYKQKYGKKAAKTPRRKMHLSIDVDMNVHAIAITGTDVSDSEGMERVLPADLPVDCLIADGAYYSIERAEELSRSGVLPIIPPPSHAVVHGEEQTRWHDKIVSYIREKGIYAFTRNTAMGSARWLKRRSPGSSVASARPC